MYEGDRTREDLVAFAHRLMGPPVNLIDTRLDFEKAKEKSELFFLFSGEETGPVFVSQNHLPFTELPPRLLIFN